MSLSRDESIRYEIRLLEKDLERQSGDQAEKTKAAILTFGHSDRTVNDVKKFIDVYDPKTGEVPQGLPIGDE